eukprot:6268400-Amphidinium_carterae.1
MEEIFLDMEMMTMMILKMTMKDSDHMIIPMPKCTVGAIYAERNAFPLRGVSGVAFVDRESCMPSV